MPNPQIPSLHLNDCHLSCLLDISPRLIFKAVLVLKVYTAVLHSCAFLICPIRAIYVAKTHTRLTVLIISPTRLKIPVKMKGHSQRLYRSYTLENSKLLNVLIEKFQRGFSLITVNTLGVEFKKNYQICVLRFTIALFTSLFFRCL